LAVLARLVACILLHIAVSPFLCARPAAPTAKPLLSGTDVCLVCFLLPPSRGFSSLDAQPRNRFALRCWGVRANGGRRAAQLAPSVLAHPLLSVCFGVIRWTARLYGPVWGSVFWHGGIDLV
jgi:hypothetical protein